MLRLHVCGFNTSRFQCSMYLLCWQRKPRVPGEQYKKISVMISGNRNIKKKNCQEIMTSKNKYYQQKCTVCIFRNYVDLLSS